MSLSFPIDKTGVRGLDEVSSHLPSLSSGPHTTPMSTLTSFLTRTLTPTSEAITTSSPIHLTSHYLFCPSLLHFYHRPPHYYPHPFILLPPLPPSELCYHLLYCHHHELHCPLHHCPPCTCIIIITNTIISTTTVTYPITTIIASTVTI